MTIFSYISGVVTGHTEYPDLNVHISPLLTLYSVLRKAVQRYRSTAKIQICRQEVSDIV